VDPWKVHLADLALQLEGGRSGHRKGTVPSTRQPLAYLQHSVDHILLRKPKRSFAATKAISGKPSQTVNVTFPPCFGFFGHLVERQHVLEAATLMQRVKKEVFGEAMSL